MLGDDLAFGRKEVIVVMGLRDGVQGYEVGVEAMVSWSCTRLACLDLGDLACFCFFWRKVAVS